MIQELRISNFALIDNLDITFESGMNAIIGETGAGKSIIIQALSLLSGKKADFDKLKDESKKAFVEAEFSFSKKFISNHPVLKDYLEEGNLVVSRSLLPSHSATSRINGETVSLSVLKKVMEDVIDIHSQLDSSLLLNEANYINILDESDPTISSIKASFSKQMSSYKDLINKKEEFIKSNDISQKDYLTYQKEEIEKAKLQPDEIENLTAELKSMESYEKLTKDFKDFADFYYSGEEGSLVSDVLNGLISRLKPLSDSVLAEKGDQALGLAENLDSSLEDLIDTFQGLDFSPERIDRINERLFNLTDLQKKYGKTTKEILSTLDSIRAKLSGIETFDEDVKKMDEDIKNQLLSVKKEAEELTKKRTAAAKALETAVNAELSSLGLKSGGFKVDIQKADLGPDGEDQVMFLISMNLGLKFTHLKDAVSGGENSRLLLALKSVFNKLSPYSCMVFDEIDSGISGEVAIKAARKIKELSSSSQIIVISHLPQVVAASEHIFYVYKDVKENVTSSHIEPIDQGRVELEIARMIGGDNPSPSSLAASKDLLASFKAKNA